MNRRISLLLVVLFAAIQLVTAQRRINWTADGLAYTKFKDGNIVRVDPKTDAETIVVKKEQLTPAGETALAPQSFDYSADFSKMLLFTNTAKVWRYKTRGDYWVLNLSNNELKKLGKGLPAQSLMFAKFSPNGKMVAYVSEHNIFTEDLGTGIIRKLTTDGTRKLINGTFDWVYEEEFGCRDGFRWSPESNQISFWQVDANKIRDYYMLNTTDSNYSRVIPVEYPKVGEAPSPVKIGVIALSNGFIRWMNIEGDPQQHYLPRMEWSGNNELIVQQLDRKQQESKLIYCNTIDGTSRTFWAENDEAWVDLNASDPAGWNWINKGQEFIWISEKDGWRHIYKISRDGKTVTLLTNGAYDIGDIKAIDEKNNAVYFTASPNNATQLYLYRAKLDGKPSGKKGIDAELVSDAALQGYHEYNISPTAKVAMHSFSNHNTPPVKEWIGLPENKPLNTSKTIAGSIKTDKDIDVEYIKITTEDNILLDAWINKPKNFDARKKYPVVLYVYGEPAATTTDDMYGNHNNFLYNGDMSADGYVQVAIDNRGTPALKGAAWRKSIYKRIGDVNIRDMAMGFKKILEYPYIDKERTAVWGWSGGGSSTLNLMFMYPDMFKTGIAIAAVGNQLNYDNIYQERYMGLPQENRDAFVKNSPISRVQGLKGNLLYIHGTGDDNVHYSNAEQLLNEL
ncbi:MAG: DPP IV N-terminal domain-containing protein, partial [Bacteroidetes bacterium]|nr:DPP IV N-terminal domain-containing protein [Bacteroidota bacterium]